MILPRSIVRSRAIFVLLLVLGADVALAQTPARAQPPEGSPVLIETVKILGGHQLHQTYLNFGLLAEARFFGRYDASELAQQLSTAVGSLDEVEKQLEKIAAVKGLSKEDAATIARVRKIASYLREQGIALQAYWDTGVLDCLKQYDVARKAAWKELDALLDLEPRTGIAPLPREPKRKP